MSTAATNRILFGLRVFAFRKGVDSFFGELLQQMELSIPLTKFMVSRQAAAEARGSFVAPVIGELGVRMAEGQAFSESSDGILSDLNVLMIHTGEKVNNVIEGVRTARFLNQSMAKISEMITTALWFPCVMLAISVAVVFFFGLTIIPEFVGLMSLKNLGVSYQIVHPFVQWSLKYAVFIIPTLILGTAYVVWSVFNLTGRVRAFLDVFVPPYNIYRLKKAGELLIIFSGMIRNGVQLDEVIATVIDRENAYIRWHLEIMRSRIADGYPLVGGVDPDGQVVVGALDTGLLPGPVIEQLMSFNNSGKLEEAMRRIGFENVDDMLKIVKKNVVTIAGCIKFLAWTVIGYIAYDTLTLSAKLSQYTQTNSF